MTPLATTLLQASPPPFPGAGELLALGNALTWGVATVLFTMAFRRGRAGDAVLVKNLGGAVVVGLAAWWLGEARGGGAAPWDSVVWMVLSGIIGLGLGDWLYFLALGHIGVARTLILIQTVPILNALLAWALIGEQLAGLQWLGVAAIVAGGWLAESRRRARKRADAVGLAAAAGAVLAFAIGNAIMAEGMKQAGLATGAAWRLAGGAIGMLMIRRFAGELRMALGALTQAGTWRLFALPSALGTWVGMAFFVGAFKYAEQGVAAALTSATPLISIPLAAVLLHERPGPRGWAGAGLVAGGAAILHLAATR